MRVLLVTPNYLPVIGGAELAVHYLALALQRLGHQPFVLCPDLGPLPPAIPFPVWRYQVPRRGGWRACSWVLRAALLRALVRSRCDVIHAHYADSAGWAACAFRPFHRRPVVVTSHGADLQTADELDYGLRRDRAVDRRVRTTMARANALIAISTEIAAEMRLAGAPAERIAQIPNGVDLKWMRQCQDGSSVAQSDASAPAASVRILAVGRNHPKKGFEHLLRAHAGLCMRDPRPHLVLIGRGTELLRPMVEKLRISHRVELRGRIPASGTALDPLHPLSPELIGELKRADIFCSPSIVEGFPLVNPEALAAGLPLVLTNVSGNREVVRDGCNGTLVPPADPQALEAALAELVADSARRARYGAASAELAPRYDWERIAADHFSVYAAVGARP